jgi:hypothetical protein
VRRVSPEGIAEWDGTISERETPDGLDYATLGALHTSPETVVMVRVQPGAGAGRLVQRRRSQRVPLGGIPASAALAGATAAAGAPLAIEADAETIAQLTDVSVHGAGMVLNSPLPGGATVALRFELPGEDAPFSLRGRVVEPAGETPAGSGGFRRGVEFIGTAANSEVRRLAAAVTRLLGNRQGSPAAGAPVADAPVAGGNRIP